MVQLWRCGGWWTECESGGSRSGADMLATARKAGRDIGLLRSYDDATGAYILLLAKRTKGADAGHSGLEEYTRVACGLTRKSVCPPRARTTRPKAIMILGDVCTVPSMPSPSIAHGAFYSGFRCFKRSSVARLWILRAHPLLCVSVAYSGRVAYDLRRGIAI